MSAIYPPTVQPLAPYNFTTKLSCPPGAEPDVVNIWGLAQT